MKSIRLVDVKKSYGGEVIFEHINLMIPAGQFFALLGPSGCGKTTILRLIAGFETVDEGKIYLGDRDITYLPINERPINTVFQNYALFPHLNVFHNVAFIINNIARKVFFILLKNVYQMTISQAYIVLGGTPMINNRLYNALHMIRKTFDWRDTN